jgi:hypothetical protein
MILMRIIINKGETVVIKLQIVYSKNKGYQYSLLNILLITVTNSMRVNRSYDLI